MRGLHCWGHTHLLAFCPTFPSFDVFFFSIKPFLIKPFLPFCSFSPFALFSLCFPTPLSLCFSFFYQFLILNVTPADWILTHSWVWAEKMNHHFSSFFLFDLLFPPSLALLLLLLLLFLSWRLFLGQVKGIVGLGCSLGGTDKIPPNPEKENYTEGVPVFTCVCVHVHTFTCVLVISVLSKLFG